MKYGIWITLEYWACENGGDDLFGTKEEMEAKLAEWLKEEEGNRPGIQYEVRPVDDVK